MRRALILMVVFALFAPLAPVSTVAVSVEEAGGPNPDKGVLSNYPSAEAVSTRAGASDNSLDRPAAAAGTPTNLLYPDDLDPPESCGVPMRGPFGKDEEIFLAPWREAEKGYRVDLTPGWYPQGTIDPRVLESDIAAVVLDTERIYAVWSNLFDLTVWRPWESGYDDLDNDRPGGWDTAWELERLSPDGNPAVLSRHPENWSVFARAGKDIFNWEANYGELGTWQPIQGINNAASDPAVITKDPHHMAVFYRDEDGAVWFTEGLFIDEGTAVRAASESETTMQSIWRSVPVSLSGAELEFTAFLPLIIRGVSQGIARMGVAPAPDRYIPTLGATDVFTLTSELSVASRNENHLAVFGVDVRNQLWVREWTSWNESDWSDTTWVKLMDDVKVERPGVASRHSNHLGVAVRSTSDEPFYIDWNHATGWQAPLSLEGSVEAPLTPAATSTDALSVFSVDGNKIWHKDWTETGGWGPWQVLADSQVQNGQPLTAVVRRLGDVMLLGRNIDDSGVYVQYTSQSRELTKTEFLPESGPYLRSALAWVGDRTLWVRAHPEPGPGPTHWAANGFDMQEEISATLVLADHPLDASEPEPVSLASGDLDFDSDEEVVVTTRVRTPSPEVTISLLDLSVSPTLTITQIASATVNVDVMDISVALGDLDGDGVQNEVALAGAVGDKSAMRLWIFEYLTATQQLELRDSWEKSWGEGDRKDVELAVGNIYSDAQCAGEQIVLLGTSMNPGAYGWVRDHLVTLCLVAQPSSWGLEVIDNYTGDIGDSQGYAVAGWWDYYRSAVGTGDIDADGYDEIATTFGTAFFVIDPSSDKEVRWLSTEPKPIRIRERSLDLGDIDRDGRAEMVYKYVDAEEDPKIAILEVMSDGELVVTRIDEEPIGTTLHIGDLDNDSFQAELVGCAMVTEKRVIGVVNGVPRWYEDDGQGGRQPINISTGFYAIEEAGGSGESHGFTSKTGASLTVGFEGGVSFFGVDVKVSASFKHELMKTFGWRDSSYESKAQGSGYRFIDPTTVGMVLYDSTDHVCYYYDVYQLDRPQDASRTMACRPTGADEYQAHMSLESWRAQATKQDLGPSWADVGHSAPSGVQNNDLEVPGNYAVDLPVDPWSLRYNWDDAPIMVSGDIQGGFILDWYFTDSMGTAHTSTRSLEYNQTATVGAKTGGVTVEASITTGFGRDTSHETTWESTLSFGGGVNKFVDDPDDPTDDHQCYRLVPYVYQAVARTLAGVSYPYWELDYFVPWIGPCTSSRSGDTEGSPATFVRPGVR